MLHVVALHEPEDCAPMASLRKRGERGDVTGSALGHRVGEVSEAIVVNEVAILDLDVVQPRFLRLSEQEAATNEWLLLDRASDQFKAG